jgi:hypothetical protein
MQHSRVFDRIAIALSAICIVHCLAVPLLVALLPIAAVSFGNNQHFHEVMLWLVVPTSLVGFGMGLRVHRQIGIVLLGAAGVIVLWIVAIHGHETWRADVEAVVSVAGSLVLGGAHWMNFRAVRRCHLH